MTLRGHLDACEDLRALRERRYSNLKVFIYTPHQNKISISMPPLELANLGSNRTGQLPVGRLLGISYFVFAEQSTRRATALF